MPGLSFVCNFKGRLEGNTATIEATMDSILHYDDYQKTLLGSDQFYLLACTKYKEYPLTCFDDEDLLICLEGRIYNKADGIIERELRHLADWLLEPSTQNLQHTRKWLLDTDGDFIVFILYKPYYFVRVLTDALGRLPLYYSSNSDGFIASRELGFIKALSDHLKLDRMGIAQYVLFGYPLGIRTLLDNVYRVTPASLITVDIRQSRATIRQLHKFDFATKSHSGLRLEDNARELVRLFAEACRNRAVGVDSGSSNGKNVVGLSGGFDSRSVAACFQRQNIPFVAVTRLDASGRCAPDASVARQLAHALRLDWRLIHLKPARGRDLLKLLRLKGGLNYLGMAFIVPCFEELRQNYGPQMLYFTGEGGNTVPRDLRAPWELRGLDETVNTLLARHQKISIEDVALLTKISREDIVAEIKGLIETYPEDTWCQKYVHFFVSEKSFKLTFEAEDRNRCFFWSMAPFFALQFVKYAMECPDHQKERLALYRQFLMSLSPIASSIAHANLKVAMDGHGFVISQRIRSIVDRYPTSLRRWLSGLTKTRPNGPDGYYMCINEQVRNGSALENYLDCGVLSRIVSQSSSNEVQNLLTITSVIEQFESNNITISKYYEMEFS